MGNDTSICLMGPLAIPFPLLNTTTCPPGWYCPHSVPSNPISVPSMCPPTVECQLQRLKGEFCEPQGKYEPLLCPPGKYCPDQYHMDSYVSGVVFVVEWVGDGIVVQWGIGVCLVVCYRCPPGTFCIPGSVEPSSCGLLSYCPEESPVRKYYGGLVMSASLDLLLLAVFLFHRLWFVPRRVAAAKARLALRRSGQEVSPEVVGEFLHREEVRAARFVCATWSEAMRRAWNNTMGVMCPGSRMESPEEGRGSVREPLMRKGGGGFDTGSEAGSGRGMELQDEAKEGEGGWSGLEERGFADAVAEFSALARPGVQSSREMAEARHALVDAFRDANEGLRLEFTFTGIRWALPPPLRTVILEEVTGEIRAGRVTAIMGPSGAGKTSFLSVLMGRVQRSAGELRINGYEDEIRRFKSVVGFVPQEDIMLRELTVRENIRFSARVRLPRAWSDSRVDAHVEAVIDVLGLAEVADQPIGDVATRGVSGGQRKRVNIGMELAVAPACLFLDEPTSGLDSAAALEVTHTLRRVADLGVTVVAVVHQPRLEIFESLDDLLLLEPGGRVAFMGPQPAVVPWFESIGYAFPPRHNPADDILDFVAGRRQPSTPPPGLGRDHQRPSQRWSKDGLRFVAQWKADHDAEDSSVSSYPPLDVHKVDKGSFPSPFFSKPSTTHSIQTPPSKAPSTPSSSPQLPPLPASSAGRGASFLLQVWLCFWRSMVQQTRAVEALWLELGVGFLAGTFMGVSFGQLHGLFHGILKPPYTLLSPSPLVTIIPSCGMYVALAIGVAGSPAGVKTFGEEKEVYYREAASGHSPLAYYIAKMLSAIPRFSLAALHFVAIFYFFATPVTNFGKFYFLSWLEFYAVYGLASLTSMMVRRENAALLAVIISLVAGCLSGYGPSLIQFTKWGFKWAVGTSYSRWGVELLMHWETMPYREHFLVTQTDGMANFWGYDVDRPHYDVFMMLLIGSIYRVIAYFLLIIIERDKQK